MKILSREQAEVYASWFRCLADPTRLQVLFVLASEMRPMRVGEIADAIGFAQSTTSSHLQRLLDDDFVSVDRSGTSSWFAINRACIEEFPQAAAIVMGNLSGTVPLEDSLLGAPWRAPARRDTN
jgi:DNA-binding transcriptional ArsR family regulator